ncbi:heme ABC exporter ATP-binding protein CcmA [Roseiterribacter gracilis]|uniref:Cytochrome c biogenesis ATP-binding export protein CcmA n=1 Tax=Roseiterribacter gracilis TaxID=2812848 RepID=A0A8S8XBK2_9PROT|nr:cytochrome c biogenesis ATP-binding export protein CcmA [Rhodospirillales bacterium TMPK1]
MPAPRLIGRDLACRRGGRLVFRDLGLELGPGEALVLTGPNGAGKSSLLRLLAGLTPPEAGTLTLDGAPADRELLAQTVALLGHETAIKSVLTVGEQIGRTGCGVDAALHAFDLLNLRDTPGRLLSAGQKRRAALARVLASNRAIWLLDEPTLGLDASSQALLANAIEGQRARGGSVVVATHAELGVANPRELKLGA